MLNYNLGAIIKRIIQYWIIKDTNKNIIAPLVSGKIQVGTGISMRLETK